MEVLDQRLLERGGVVGLADQGRDRLEPDPAGGPPAALAGDQLVAVAARAHEHRLEHADLADRVGERRERLLVEVLAGLETVRPDRRHRELLEPADARPGLGPPAG